MNEIPKAPPFRPCASLLILIALHPLLNVPLRHCCADDDVTRAGASSDEGAAESATRPFDLDATAFTEDEHYQLFVEARAAFEKRDWREARDAARKSMRGVRPEKKEFLDAWVRGASAGARLDRVQADFDNTKLRKAWLGLHKLDKYKDTPLVSLIEETRQKIEEQLFRVLADFEPDPSDDTEPSNKKDADDAAPRFGLGRTRPNDKPEFAHEGTHSLAWLPGSMGGIVLATTGPNRIGGWGDSIVRFDGDLLNAYRYLNIAIRGDADEAVTVALLFDNRKDNRLVIDGITNVDKWIFQEVAVPPMKWVELRIDLWSSKVRLDDWGQVYGFSLGRVLPKKGDHTLYVDSIRLEKP